MRSSTRSGQLVRELTYCSGHIGALRMNRSLVFIFARGLRGKLSSHCRMVFSPRPSRKSKNVHISILIQEILKDNILAPGAMARVDCKWPMEQYSDHRSHLLYRFSSDDKGSIHMGRLFAFSPVAHRSTFRRQIPLNFNQPEFTAHPLLLVRTPVR